MTRQKMIDALIEYHISSIENDLYSQEYILLYGWKGFNEYTDEELKREIEMTCGWEDLKTLINDYYTRWAEQRKIDKASEKRMKELEKSKNIPERKSDEFPF